MTTDDSQVPSNPATTEATPADGPAVLDGVVNSFQVSYHAVGAVPTALTVWNFLLAHVDGATNTTVYTPVHMISLTFDYVIHDGEEVTVTGTMQDGILHATSLVSKLTNAVVNVKIPWWLKFFVTPGTLD